MNPSEASSLRPLFFSEEEQQELWIAAKKTEIPLLIMQDLIASDQTAPNGFAILAQKKIKPALTKELDQMDQQINMIFQRLFIETLTHIQQHSQPILQTFDLINLQTGKGNSSGEFLGAYVYDSVMELQKLL